MNVIPIVKKSERNTISKGEKLSLGVILGVLLIGWCWNIFSLWL